MIASSLHDTGTAGCCFGRFLSSVSPLSLTTRSRLLHHYVVLRAFCRTSSRCATLCHCASFPNELHRLTLAIVVGNMADGDRSSATSGQGTPKLLLTKYPWSATYLALLLRSMMSPMDSMRLSPCPSVVTHESLCVAPLSRSECPVHTASPQRATPVLLRRFVFSDPTEHRVARPSTRRLVWQVACSLGSRGLWADRRVARPSAGTRVGLVRRAVCPAGPWGPLADRRVTRPLAEARLLLLHSLVWEPFALVGSLARPVD